MKIVSRKQQGFFGAIQSGKISSPGLKPAKAAKMLRENKGRMKDLPERAPGRMAKRTNARSGRR